MQNFSNDILLGDENLKFIKFAKMKKVLIIIAPT